MDGFEKDKGNTFLDPHRKMDDSIDETIEIKTFNRKTFKTDEVESNDDDSRQTRSTRKKKSKENFEEIEQELDEDEPKAEEEKDATIVRRIVLAVSLILIITVFSIGIYGYNYVKSAVGVVDPKDTTEINVNIPIGSSVTQIAQILSEQGVIKSSKIFRYYVKFKNHADFMAGDYVLTKSMTLDTIIEELKTGKIVEAVKLKITIPEGKTLDQIAMILSQKVGYKKEDILAKLNDTAYIDSLIEKYPEILSSEILDKNILYPLEGYLFPATYSFKQEKPTIEEMIDGMLDKTYDILGKYQTEMGEMELTPHKLLTMASLIEKEATKEVDRKKIASVFYNRLRTGMPLQTDPTILYALGTHKERVLYADLEVKSPYNTYKNKGLTPGPIANAGEMSIEAALDPEQTKYFYFLAKPNGEVVFSKTLEEHNKLKAQYLGQ